MTASIAPRRATPASSLLVVAAGGWLLLAAHAAHATDGHRHASGDPVAAVAGPAMWAAMVAATMLPSIVPNVRFVALRSPSRDRSVAVFDVVFGWALVWLAVSVAIWAATTLMEGAVGRPASFAAAVVVATGWQATGRKRVSVARCRRTFAPPLAGAEARRARRGFGVRLGVECSASCWALMAAMAAGGHQPLVVLPLAWVSWYERRRPHHDQPVLSTAAVVAAAGVVAGVWIR